MCDKSSRKRPRDSDWAQSRPSESNINRLISSFIGGSVLILADATSMRLRNASVWSGSLEANQMVWSGDCSIEPTTPPESQTRSKTRAPAFMCQIAC